MQIELETLKKIEKKFGLFQVIIVNNTTGFLALGKTLPEWIGFSCAKYPSKIIEYNKSLSLLDQIKPHLSSVATHSVILFSSTPLITEQTLDRIIEYVQIKDVLACKLPVGCVLNNEYAKKAKEISYDSVFTHCYDDFYLVETKKQLSGVSEVLRKRVVDYHIQNGVNIISPAPVTIEPEVNIDKDVDIYANNTLKGTTTISSGVILKEGNVVSNSSVGCNCCLSHAIIENSKLGKNVYIKPYSIVQDSKINNNKIIEAHSKIIKNKYEETNGEI